MTTNVDAFRSDFDVEAEGVSARRADILWRDHAGNDVLWLMNNNRASSIAALPSVTPDWHVKATANFDSIAFNDADILWQNDNGALALWKMTGTTVSAIHALPNPGPTWHVVADDDFNLDYGDDILFRNDNGALAMWTGIDPATGTVSGMFAGTQNPGPTWHVVGTGDTAGILEASILWQNDNGALALWQVPTFGAGTFTFNTVAALPTVDTSWHVKGMANVSGHGRSDIVFQNDNGAVVVWEMGGVGMVTAMNLVNLGTDWGPTWHVVGLRDMNGDLKADVVLQNDNGSAAVWEDYTSFGEGVASFLTVGISPNPNPNGHVWDLL